MFGNTKKDKIKTLEPKKDFLINDINFNEIDLGALSTLIFVASLFLISMRILIATGI